MSLDDLHMRQKTILRIAQANILCSLVIMFVAFMILGLIGVDRADRIFHRCEAVSIAFAVSALLLGVKFCAIDWMGRPEKQQDLRNLKILAFLAFVVGVPGVIIDWIAG
jgi:multisubunit Na+/H+ antiporter MnhG subunit